MNPSTTARIGLSTASVYPESTASGFELAARLGYDGVEVMVGIDPLSTQIDAIQRLVDYHQLPVLAIHAPCLLITQRVWGTDPWGKLERSAEAAKRARRRRGRRPSAVPLAARLRPRVRRGDRAAGGRDRRHLRGREHVPVARAGHGACRRTRRAGTRPSRTTRTPPSTCRTRRPPSRTASSWPATLGDRLTHIHLTDGTGSAKDEHLVPGRGTQRGRGSAGRPGEPGLRAVTSSSRSTPAARPAGPSARSTWSSRSSSPANTSSDEAVLRDPRSDRGDHATARCRSVE